MHHVPGLFSLFWLCLLLMLWSYLVSVGKPWFPLKISLYVVVYICTFIFTIQMFSRPQTPYSLFSYLSKLSRFSQRSLFSVPAWFTEHLLHEIMMKMGFLWPFFIDYGWCIFKFIDWFKKRKIPSLKYVHMSTIRNSHFKSSIFGPVFFTDSKFWLRDCVGMNHK